jgi:cystathionine beta-lyase
MANPLTAFTLEQLRRRTSAKWRRYDDDVLPLWVAEMDVALAPAVVEAVEHAMATGDSGYPWGDAYAQALAAFARERWDLVIDVEATANVADVMGGIAHLLGLVTGAGDPVVINPPVYTPFYDCLEHLGRRIVEVPLSADHRLDLDAVERAFAQVGGRRGRAAHLLCSPHNPTGTVHTREELEAVAALAERHGVRVLVDEIHAPLVYPPAVHVPYLSVRGSERGFALLSASKGWNLAGLKAAVAVAGPEAAGELADLPMTARHGASHLGIIAHVAALREGGAWLDDLLVSLDANRRLLGDLLAVQLPGVAYREPAGTGLAWLDCRALGLGDDPAEVFLSRGRVALNPGAQFGTGGAGHARLNLATSPEILREAVTRMAAALP